MSNGTDVRRVAVVDRLLDRSADDEHRPDRLGGGSLVTRYHDKGRLWAIGYRQGLRDPYCSMRGAGGE